jgi:hypothetical protein
MYNVQEDKEIYYKFMDNVHKGKQIYYRVYGQCVGRQAYLLQSSWTMCTKASRSTTELMDNVYEGKQIYYRVHRHAQSKRQRRH